MFREMRRIKQLLSKEESEKVLMNNTSGIVSVIGDEGYPYGVPVSYHYMDGKIYFHSAKSGHKIDAMNANEKVSFCVMDQDEIVPEELTTYFRSVILFGKARILEPGEELNKAIYALARKYAPELPEERLLRSMKNELKNMAMVAIDIEHMTGKEAVELVRRKQK